jgi:hypothetical protein
MSPQFPCGPKGRSVKYYFCKLKFDGVNNTWGLISQVLRATFFLSDCINILPWMSPLKIRSHPTTTKGSFRANFIFYKKKNPFYVQMNTSEVNFYLFIFEDLSLALSLIRVHNSWALSGEYCSVNPNPSQDTFPTRRYLFIQPSSSWPPEGLNFNPDPLPACESYILIYNSVL